jgi:hypothetical protein
MRGKWEIKLNAKKTQCIRFGPKLSREQRFRLKLDGRVVSKVTKIKYLGVWLDSQMRSDEQIAEKKLSTIRAFNALRKVGIASREMSASIKTFLLKVYCRPILYYGAQNLILNKRDIKAMQSA